MTTPKRPMTTPKTLSNRPNSSSLGRNVLGTIASLQRPQTNTNMHTDASKSMNPSVFLCISEARRRANENEIAIASMNVVSGKCPVQPCSSNLNF